MKTVWSGRTIPPEPDDWYHYLFHIRKFADYGLKPIGFLKEFRETYNTGLIITDMRLEATLMEPYFGWAYPLGLLQSALSLTPEKTAHLIYMVFGVLGVAAVSLWVLWRLPRKNSPWMILALSLFAGHGAIHGFFYVVPSFLINCLQIIIFVELADKKPRAAFLFVPWMLFSHLTSGPIALITLASITIITIIEDRKINKTVWVYLLLITTTALSYVVLRHFEIIPQIHMDSAIYKKHGSTAPFSFNTITEFRFKWGSPVVYGAILLLPLSLRTLWGRRLFIHIIVFVLAMLFLAGVGNPTPERLYVYIAPYVYLLFGLGAGELIKKPVVLILLSAVYLAEFKESYRVHRWASRDSNYNFKIKEFENTLNKYPDGTLILYDGLYSLHYAIVRGGFRFSYAYYKEPINRDLVPYVLFVRQINNRWVISEIKKPSEEG